MADPLRALARYWSLGGPEEFIRYVGPTPSCRAWFGGDGAQCWGGDYGVGLGAVTNVPRPRVTVSRSSVRSSRMALWTVALAAP